MCNRDVGEDVWSHRLYTERPSGVASAGPSTQIKAPQPKEEGGSPMSGRGKGLREMHTASASEGTATPVPSNAQGVKPPPGFGPKPENPESQPIIWTVIKEPLSLEELYEMLLVSTVIEYHNVMIGELSMVIETMNVQSEEVICPLLRATVMKLPPYDS